MAELTFTCTSSTTVSGTVVGGEIQKRRLILLSGDLGENSTIDISTPGPDWNAYGDIITWDDAEDFVENVSVFLNGVLQLPASGSSDDNDVYHVTAPDQLAFEYKLKENDIIQIWKFPPSS